MNKAVFLDRDGVINFDSKDYIKSPEEWRCIPGSLEAIRLLHQAGYKIGIATNQSGIARGLYNHATLEAIHHRLHVELEALGAQVDAIQYCPHLPIEKCACRKPKPQMLINLAEALDAALPETPFVGDRMSDISAALEAGARPILIRSPMTYHRETVLSIQVPTYDSLLDFVKDWLR